MKKAMPPNYKLPLVSVVVPNYNHAIYLDRRLQSVLNQTYRNIEVIYLDDASTDDSNSVLQHYKADSRVRVYFNDVNSGSPFKQWNKGVALATGKYVWLAEADDWAELNFLETLVDRLESNPAAGLAYSQSWIADRFNAVNGLYTSQWDETYAARWQRDYVADGQQECVQHLIGRCTIPNASAVLFRRDVFNKIGGANGAMRYAGDWELWMRMLLVSDVSYVAEPLNYFRFHQKSVTASSFNSGKRIAEAYMVMYAGISGMPVPLDVLKNVCRMRALDWAAFIVSRYGVSEWSSHRMILHQARKVDAQIARSIQFAILSMIKGKTCKRLGGANKDASKLALTPTVGVAE